MPSIGMDIDNVDFTKEPFDCAILPGNGHFGAGTRYLHLFDEWSLPLCAPDLLENTRDNLASCEHIPPHASDGTDSDGGHGVTIGDFLLIQTAMDQHLLAPLFPLAIGTGEGFYLV
ncbi:hypothetical protein [Citrobacter sp. MNAZ 1397]|uniref:hypothetical protein n=1 Tax=Citrobacter sp. MNAZ 1397 TaxID=2911205 RepID=UPI002025F7E6|nr:hypothetical protein [Citrobacter sp. MNAZ 1397]MCL9670774.1 hypothetical protein [Citrobacter sp. MNAZ 1397]